MNRSSIMGKLPSFVAPSAAPVVAKPGAVPSTLAGPGFERVVRTVQPENIVLSIPLANKEETLVLSTTTPRRGIDVFVQGPGISNGYFHVRIYAIVGGVRALVGGGFVTGISMGARVAAARTWAERFEVTYVAVGTITDERPITISAIAGDNLPELPDDFGVTPVIVAARRSTGALIIRADATDLQPVGADAVNTTATPIYVQIFNQRTIGAGQPADHSMLVPPNASVSWRLPASLLARFTLGTTFGISVDADSYDTTGLAGGDVRWSAFVKG